MYCAGSSAKVPSMASSKPKKQQQQQQQWQQPQGRFQQATKPADKDFGRWERYTNKFGSKMLSKMGWKQGTGLGSLGRGIVNPVRATSHKDFGKGLTHMQVKASLLCYYVTRGDVTYIPGGFSFL